MGNLTEAEAEVNRVLKVDPTNAQAQKLKKEVDPERSKTAAARFRARKSWKRCPKSGKMQIATSTLVQDGRMLIEMGKLDEAEAKLLQAVRRNPEDRNAFYYLSVIKEARYRSGSAQTRNLGQGCFSRGREILECSDHPRKAARRPILLPRPIWFGLALAVRCIYQKLDKIILNEVLYDGLPLSEVVRDLERSGAQARPGQTRA